MRFLKVLGLIAAGCFLLSLGGCVTHGRKWESRSIVQHYEAKRQDLKKKERSGAEGGCPTCVY